MRAPDPVWMLSIRKTSLAPAKYQSPIIQSSGPVPTICRCCNKRSSWQITHPDGKYVDSTVTVCGTVSLSNSANDTAAYPTRLDLQQHRSGNLNSRTTHVLTTSKCQRRQAMYVYRNIVARLRNQCSRGKVVSVAYSECASAALFIKQAKRTRRSTATCWRSGCTNFFHIIL